MKNNCNSIRQQLSDVLDGFLDAEEETRVREHLAGCEDCREEFESLRRAVRAVNDLPGVKAPEGFDQRVLDRIARSAPKQPRRGIVQLALRLAPVAALFLVVVGVTLAVYGGGYVREDARKAQAPAPAADRLTDRAEPAVPAPTAEREIAEDRDAAEGLEAADEVAMDAAEVPRRDAGRLMREKEAPESEAFEAEMLAERTMPRARSVRTNRADQVLVIHTDEPSRVKSALVKLARRQKDGADETGVVEAEDHSYFVAVPTARYEAVLKELARLTPPQEKQELVNVDGLDLEAVRKAPAWHAGFRQGMQVAQNQPVEPRRAEGFAGASVTMDAGAQAKRSGGEEPATAYGSDAETEADAAAAPAPDDGEKAEAKEEGPMVGEKELAFVTILVRILPLQPPTQDAAGEAEEESAATEEPAQ